VPALWLCRRLTSRISAPDHERQSPEQADEVLAEYERREREGPDFMRIRPQSVIADAPLVSLDRNERIRLMGKFRALSRRSWVAKESGRHRGVITRTAESVFGALMYLTEKYGRVFPSLEGLAHLAMCCKQSVVTALDDLERLGFVTRIRRVRRFNTPLGFRTVQITNAYRVHEPASGRGLLTTLVFATESNCWTASAHVVDSEIGEGEVNPANSLHQACYAWGERLEARKAWRLTARQRAIRCRICKSGATETIVRRGHDTTDCGRSAMTSMNTATQTTKDAALVPADGVSAA
jgi:hypothetical protein